MSLENNIYHYYYYLYYLFTHRLIFNKTYLMNQYIFEIFLNDKNIIVKMKNFIHVKRVDFHHTSISFYVFEIP